MALVEAARKQKLAGATVIRGIEGYGMRQNQTIHTAKLFELASELPIVVIVMAPAEAIAQFLPSCTGNGNEWNHCS
jgi:PII-like signaling protein